MTIVRLDQVGKFYGDVEAVKNVSFKCNDGEMVALLGPSGCGKSTILKSLAGIEEITSGEIFFDETPVSGLAPGARNIAMVFEDYALYPHLSVRKNIEYPLRVRKFPKTEVDIRREKVVKLLNLESVLDENVQSLSGGAQQRVSIGRALVRDPNLLLFDEPLSHLDGDQKVQLRMEIKRLQKETELTSILVTHDQIEAIAMCDRVVVMNKGSIQQVGTPEALYGRPANLFVATFIGEPPMNLLPGSLTEDAGDLYAEGQGWKVKLDPEVSRNARQTMKCDSRVVIGMRAEDVVVVADHLRSHHENLISGNVFFTEMRGDTNIVLIHSDDETRIEFDHVTVDAKRLLVELDSGESIREGDRIHLNVRPELVHVFSGETGHSLRPA